MSQQQPFFGSVLPCLGLILTRANFMSVLTQDPPLFGWLQRTPQEETSQLHRHSVKATDNTTEFLIFGWPAVVCGWTCCRVVQIWSLVSGITISSNSRVRFQNPSSICLSPADKNEYVFSSDSTKQGNIESILNPNGSLCFCFLCLPCFG